VLLVAFVVHALRLRTIPLIDLRLLGSRPFAASAALMFLAGLVLFGAVSLLPLYLQLVRGYTAVHAGLLLAPQGLGMGISLIVAGRLLDRVPPRWIVLVGLGLTGTASLFFTQLSPSTHQGAIAATLVVSGLGLGAVLVPVMSTAIVFLRPAQMARASSTVRIFQQLGGAFAGAVVAMVLQRRISAALADGTGLTGAFGGTYWWLLAFTALALVPALLLPGRLPDTSPVDQPVAG